MDCGWVTRAFDMDSYIFLNKYMIGPRASQTYLNRSQIPASGISVPTWIAPAGIHAALIA
jgi:hypothetical protein